MEPNQERSLIPQPSHELTATQTVRSRILAGMVEDSLALAKEVIGRNIDLELLVQEAKRLQEGGAGNEMTPNNIRAFQLFLRAAEGGHVEAQYEVAMCFGWGGGVARNEVKCDGWLKLAAEQGHVDAQSNLGMFRLGKSEEAAKWLRRAAEQGDWDAQTMLGLRLSAGEGMPQDDCEAYAWLQLAADAEGEGWAQEQATAVASCLSSTQMEKAHELYQDFKRKYSATH